CGRHGAPEAWRGAWRTLATAWCRKTIGLTACILTIQCVHPIKERRMTFLFVAVLALHALSAVFWAGTTFAIARSQGQGAAQLRLPQRGAATGAIVTGALLFGIAHHHAPGRYEIVLAIGALAAIAAAVVQYATSAAAPQPDAAARMLRGQRVSAVLLAL